MEGQLLRFYVSFHMGNQPLYFVYIYSGAVMYAGGLLPIPRLLGGLCIAVE